MPRNKYGEYLRSGSIRSVENHSSWFQPRTVTIHTERSVFFYDVTDGAERGEYPRVEKLTTWIITVTIAECIYIRP